MAKQEERRYWNLYSEGKISTTDLIINVAKTHNGLSCKQIEEETGKIDKVPHAKDFIKKLKSYYLPAISSQLLDSLKGQE